MNRWNAGVLVFISIGALAATTQPAANVSALLDQVDRAYADLHSAEFDGKITGHFDVGGQQKDEDISFASVFRAPNQFKHDARGDVILGSTGQTAYAFQPAHNVYVSADAPKGRSVLADWPRAIPGILRQQNPALLLTINRSAGGALNELGEEMNQLPDTPLDGQLFHVIQFVLPDDHEEVTLLIDPHTSLIRQARFDLRKSMEDRGTTDVKVAAVTIDYTKVETDVALDDKQFAWNPPVGAILASAMAEENAAALAMVGKTAPDFSLNDLDDKTVKLSSLKGSVVLLDFWASWCAPCLVSLPGIDQLNKDQSPNGLKVFAINQMDDRDVVKKLVAEKKLSLPVLLDPQGDAGKSYSADPLPVTVLIGKDGIIKKVFSGSDNDEAIRAAVAKEMGG